MASAKLANNTVRISQTVIEIVKVPGCAIASRRVTIDPTRTTNMTGLRTWTRGSNFLKASKNAWCRISGSKRPRALATPCEVDSLVGVRT